MSVRHWIEPCALLAGLFAPGLLCSRYLQVKRIGTFCGILLNAMKLYFCKSKGWIGACVKKYVCSFKP